MFRNRGREGGGEREKHPCAREKHRSAASHRGPGPKPRHVPWPGIRQASAQSNEPHQSGPKLSNFKTKGYRHANSITS